VVETDRGVPAALRVDHHQPTVLGVGHRDAPHEGLEEPEPERLSERHEEDHPACGGSGICEPPGEDVTQPAAPSDRTVPPPPVGAEPQGARLEGVASQLAEEEGVAL
jgi:hypothetical protein